MVDRLTDNCSMQEARIKSLEVRPTRAIALPKSMAQLYYLTLVAIDERTRAVASTL